MGRVALVALAYAAASAFGAANSERDDGVAEKVARVHETEAVGPATLDGRLFAAAEEEQSDSYAVCWARISAANDDKKRYTVRYSSKAVPMQGEELEDLEYVFRLHVEEHHLTERSRRSPVLDSVRCVSAKTRLRARAMAGKEIATQPDTANKYSCEHDFLSDL